MKNRVIFDTNIYGFLADEHEIKKIESYIIQSDKLIIYGCQIIRGEIRKNKSKKTRNAILDLYDHITKGKSIKINTKTEKLAKEYQKEAKKIGKEKVKSMNENWEDMLIIAAASLNKLDIVFTADRKTMCGEFNTKAYEIINLKHGLRSPNLYNYELLKKSFIK